MDKYDIVDRLEELKNSSLYSEEENRELENIISDFLTYLGYDTDSIDINLVKDFLDYDRGSDAEEMAENLIDCNLQECLKSYQVWYSIYCGNIKQAEEECKEYRLDFNRCMENFLKWEVLDKMLNDISNGGYSTVGEVVNKIYVMMGEIYPDWD